MILKCTAAQELTDLCEFINKKALMLGMTIMVVNYKKQVNVQQVAVLCLNQPTCLKIPLLQEVLRKAKITAEPLEQRQYGI